MTLPVALLIASFKHESISHEFREILGEGVSMMESLSCKCKDHISRLHLVPPSSCCSSDRSSPTSDFGSEISSSSLSTVKSYSYFSDYAEEVTLGDCAEQTDIDVGRCLSVLVDLVENVTVRFNESYIFKEAEVKINYQKRDLLDLGGNMQANFELQHPALKKNHVRKYPRAISVPKNCTASDCDFEDWFPMNY